MDGGARFAFRPDPGRTRIIDAEICRALGESLQVVAHQADQAGFDVDRRLAPAGTRISALTGAPPQLWACYHDLVQAGIRGDHGGFRSSAADLLAVDLDTTASCTVVTLTDHDLGPNLAERYRAIIDADVDLPLNLRPASPEIISRMSGLVGDARDLLSRACPDLAAELEILGHQVVLASSGPGTHIFGGAATIFLWGAIICNPDQIRDRLAMAECLAHETAHALLFGMTLGADLTLNDAEERYSSPLRIDPRPMEGIVHATYVLGRMIETLDRLAASGLLSSAEREQLATMRSDSLRLFRAGAQTAREHARFTDAGRTIFGHCQAAIEAQHGSS